jgi:hypothetical protein
VEWKGLQKHRHRTATAHKIKEDKFIERLDDLFDIAHADALTMISILRDRDFLLSQMQKGRPGSVGAADIHGGYASKTACTETEGSGTDAQKRMLALCFDTTASNTGHRSGACFLI